jgi:hypothetical protein
MEIIARIGVLLLSVLCLQSCMKGTSKSEYYVYFDRNGDSDTVRTYILGDTDTLFYRISDFYNQTDLTEAFFNEGGFLQWALDGENIVENISEGIKDGKRFVVYKTIAIGSVSFQATIFLNNMGRYDDMTINVNNSNKIVFEKGGEIWSIKPDGTELTKLTNEAGNASTPTISPNGTKVAYLSGGFVKVLDLNSNTVNTLSVFANNIKFVRNSNDVLAYTAGVNEFGTIYISGGNATPFPLSYGVGAIKNIFIHDVPNTSCAYVLFNQGEYSVRVYQLPFGTSNSRRIDYDTDKISDVIVSPNTEFVAYSIQLGTNEIFLATTLSGPIINISNHQANDFAPSFSPDGRKIVFSSDRKGNFDLFIYDLDSETITQLTDTPENEIYPSWN